MSTKWPYEPSKIVAPSTFSAARLMELVEALIAAPPPEMRARMKAVEDYAIAAERRSAPPAQAGTGELPPLPEPTVGLGVHRWAYGVEDMRRYAEQHAAAVRRAAREETKEMAAKLCDEQFGWDCAECAAAIRALP